MDGEPPALPTSRDIAGGWLLCAVIAALALGLAGAFHSGMSLDITAAMPTRSDVTAGGTACTAVARAPRLRVLAGSQHLFVPAPHPDHLRHG